MYVCLTYMHTHLDQSVDQMVSLGGMVMKLEAPRSLYSSPGYNNNISQ
jgi:hypothetical protein